MESQKQNGRGELTGDVVVECTEKFDSFCIIRSWPQLRDKALRRDNYTCVKCGLNPRRIMNSSGTTTEDAKCIAKLRCIEKKLNNGQKQLGKNQLKIGVFYG